MKIPLRPRLNKLAAQDLPSLLFKIAKIEEFKVGGKVRPDLNHGRIDSNCS